MTADGPTPRGDAREQTTTEMLLVESFLAALADSDTDLAMSMLAEDVEYSNVGLPTIRGREQVRRALGGLARPGIGFEVCTHAISSEGSVVLTERTDAIVVGRFRSQFWVCGRFDVERGEITRWRDAFDFLDITRGVLRGLVGIAVPGARPQMPGPQDTPGR